MTGSDEVVGRLVAWYPEGYGFAHVPSLPADVLVHRGAFPPRSRPRWGEMLKLRLRQGCVGRPVAASARKMSKR